MYELNKVCLKGEDAMRTTMDWTTLRRGCYEYKLWPMATFVEKGEDALNIKHCHALKLPSWNMFAKMTKKCVKSTICFLQLHACRYMAESMATHTHTHIASSPSSTQFFNVARNVSACNIEKLGGAWGWGYTHTHSSYTTHALYAPYCPLLEVH